MEVLKFPYPFQGAFTVASDIDSANPARFRAVHKLFCGSEVIGEGDPEWQTLGLAKNGPHFEAGLGGVQGLGFEFTDSFFLVGDATTFGLYRYWAERDCFQEDEQAGENCATLIREQLKAGRIDAFHAFLGYTRQQIEPLLLSFYGWCEREQVPKPSVWTNHSNWVTPCGLCPDRLQSSRLRQMAHLLARQMARPFIGGPRLSLRYAFARYQGDTPGNRYYVNDILSANGLRYVWLNTGDTHGNSIALPEYEQNGRATIIQPVVMDDGVRYWRFERCYGMQPGQTRGEIYLRDFEDGHDSSHLITEQNLAELCRRHGTCILYTHWGHFRSMPVADATIARFKLLRRWRDEGKVWVTSTAKLLEWTRRRTFLSLRYACDQQQLNVDIMGVEDPILGHEALRLQDLHGLALRLRNPEQALTVAIAGKTLSPEQVRREGDVCWLDGSGN